MASLERIRIHIPLRDPVARTFYDMISGEVDGDRWGPYIVSVEDVDAVHSNPPQDGYVVIPCRHEMSNPRPMYTVHATGNWTEDAQHGGSPRHVSVSSARLMGALVRAVHSAAASKVPVAIEATHHGPTVDTPIVCIEVGSTPAEWTSREWVGVLTRALRDLQRHWAEPPIAVSIGDLHYSVLVDRVVRGEMDICHVVPKYVQIDGWVVRAAVDRCRETVNMAVIHWKALGRDARETALRELELKGVDIVKRK